MAQLQFDKSAGVSVPAVKSIRDDLGEAFKAIFKAKGGEPEINIEPTSPLGQIVDAFAAEVAAKQAELITAKTDSLKSQKKVEELYTEAMKAFRNYSGQGDQDEY